MEMDFSIDIFYYAFNKNTENDLWEIWKLQYPQMEKETFISFADYKKENAINKVNKGSQKSYKEIEKEMEQVIKAHEEKELNKN